MEGVPFALGGEVGVRDEMGNGGCSDRGFDVAGCDMSVSLASVTQSEGKWALKAGVPLLIS